ncbi:MAG: hypothetical protein AB8G18_04135 [Gammaproteobacteria bacterium]
MNLDSDMKATNTQSEFQSLTIPLRVFLWSCRHYVHSARHDQALCTDIYELFETRGLPMVPALIEDLLAAMAQSRIRTIEFNQPNGENLLDDERNLIECFTSLQTCTSQCDCHSLSDMLDAVAMDNVVSRMHAISRVLTQHDWHLSHCLTQASSDDLKTSHTVH